QAAGLDVAQPELAHAYLRRGDALAREDVVHLHADPAAADVAEDVEQAQQTLLRLERDLVERTLGGLEEHVDVDVDRELLDDRARSRLERVLAARGQVEAHADPLGEPAEQQDRDDRERDRGPDAERDREARGRAHLHRRVSSARVARKSSSAVQATKNTACAL